MSCFYTVLYQISWNGEIVKKSGFWASLDLNLLKTIFWNLMFSREFGISCSHVIFLAGSRQSYYKPMSHTILPAHFIYSNSHQHSLRHNLNILTQWGARRQVFRFRVPACVNETFFCVHDSPPFTKFHIARTRQIEGVL